MDRKQKPVILYERENTVEDLERLKRDMSVWKICDVYKGQLKELFEINNPSLKKGKNYEVEMEKFVEGRMVKKQTLVGNWIYFPWNGRLVHSLNKKEYLQLRTNRNKNLITAEEQEKLSDFTVGILGLSVGSHIASNLTYGGVGNTMKLAEYDALDTTNLNRIRARIDEIEEPKIDITARQIYEVNPYANLVLFDQGITEQNLDEFIFKEPVPKIIFEIIDNFEMKIKLRLKAKKARIPVAMFANIGDRILFDIERYDLDDSIPLFNGLAGNAPEEIIKNPDLTDEDKNKYAVSLVGVENIPQRALDSVKEINKTLIGRPQLMSTVSITGGLAAYITKQIALGKSISSGRNLVKFGDLFY